MEDKYLIFGTGTGCDAFLVNADPDDYDSILGFIDNNKDKQGTLYRGKRIFSVDEAKDLEYNKIIIASLYYKEIKESLINKGIPEEKITSIIRDFTCSNFKQLVFLDKEKHKLKNKNFSLISPYCWGLFLYRFLGVEYKTPFAGSFIPPEFYLKLVENLNHYLNAPLEITPISGYEHIGTFCRITMDDIFIDFPHEKDPEIIEKKWNKRLERLDFNNLFIHYGNINHSLMTTDMNEKMKNFENRLTITREASYIYSGDKKIITEKEPVDLIKWFNKEL